MAQLSSTTVSGSFTVSGSAMLQSTLTVGGSITSTGAITGSKVYGAVFNDIADFVEVPEGFQVEYGRVYKRDTNYSIIKTEKKNDKTSLGIASDTYGFGVGAGENKMPIAIGGWVLACVDHAYKSGTSLVATKDGYLTKASILEKNILAIYDRPEKEKIWNGIEVNNRHWVRI